MTSKKIAKKKSKQLTQKKLVRIFKDVKALDSEQKFCFLLGAGASKSSGIPTGWELATEWYADLKEDLEETERNEWEKKIGFDEKRVSEFYPQLYQKRYESAPKIGYDKFKKIMGDKDPSIGYVILANILADTKHNFVITTNFDYLVEDAVRMYTDKKPFSAGHETLASFISSQSDHPTIIKVHRDLFLHPLNQEGEIDKLKDEWKRALRPILRNFNLLVIGYGGNDGSLMDYLKEITPEERKPIYWCKREKDSLNDKAESLLIEDDFVVTIRDFDDLMYALYGAFDYDILENLGKPDEHSFVKNTKNRIVKLYGKLEEIIDNNKKDTSLETSNVKKIFSNALKYRLLASAEKNINKKDKIYSTGIKKYPDDENILEDYAIFLKNIPKDYDKAEEYYKKAIKINPDNYANSGNYASFLWEIRKDHDKAEEYYKKAIKINPDSSHNLGNYAGFLWEIRKDYDKAEEYYKKAIKINPDSSHYLGNYAGFLWKTRKDHDKAEEYYKKAIKINPDSSHNLGNYAGFLWKTRKDHDKAEEYYEKSIEINAEDANHLGNYALFLTGIRKDHDKAGEYYKKSIKIDPENANALANYTHNLILSKNDFKTAEKYINKAFKLQPKELDILSELWFYRYAHYKKYFKEAEQELEKLVKKEANSPGWNLEPHIAIAEKNGHPDIEKLKEFAAAITKV